MHKLGKFVGNSFAFFHIYNGGFFAANFMRNFDEFILWKNSKFSKLAQNCNVMFEQSLFFLFSQVSICSS
jgi:hypothetical protein